MKRRRPTLAEELAELERTDPAVRAAAQRYDEMRARILSRCGRYIGDNDGTCPQLTCIRPKGHEGPCDNVRGDDRGPA